MKKEDIVCKHLYPDGSYVLNPHYVDYNDGVGIQLDGGMLYDKNGKAIGHIDPPGHRGHKGTVGKNCEHDWEYHSHARERFCNKCGAHE